MKKIIIIILIIVSFIVIKNLDNLEFRDKKDTEIKIETRQQDYNNLAIMLETELGSGKYKESSINTWPSNGYIFNDVLSYCENGTTLEWNNETNNVILKNVTKSDKCYVYFDKITFANYIKSLYTRDGVNNLYYHDGLGNDNASLEAGDYSYRYAGGDYHLTEQAISHGYNSIYNIIYIKFDDGSIHQNNYWWGSNRNFYLDYNQDIKAKNLKDLFIKAIENGYIEKKEVPNYVCFGSSVSECPKENLYRIIGVFNNQIKLIKAGDANKDQLGQNGSFGASVSHDVTYIGDNVYNKANFYWHKNGGGKQASWANSTLNTINLNTNFVDYLTTLEDGKWIKKIAVTNWQVGGVSLSNGYAKNAKTTYNYELGENKTSLTETKQIGLMYISDYYYAVPEKYWVLKGFDTKYTDVSVTNLVDYRGVIWDNWLWDGDSEWFITPRIENTTGIAFDVPYFGFVSSYAVADVQNAVRPCFYLNSNVEYSSGDGSLNNPYRIN